MPAEGSTADASGADKNLPESGPPESVAGALPPEMATVPHSAPPGSPIGAPPPEMTSLHETSAARLSPPGAGGPVQGRPQQTGQQGQAGGLRLPELRFPGGTAGRVAWWGGLTAVAAFGIVDWPVVGLIAVGTWVAEQEAKRAARADEQRKAAEAAASSGGRVSPA
jgi:hypothetical protein